MSDATVNFLSELNPGDIFHPQGHPEKRCLKLKDEFVDFKNMEAHFDDDLEFFEDCGEIFDEFGDMFIERVYKASEWETVSREQFLKINHAD